MLDFAVTINDNKLYMIKFIFLDFDGVLNTEYHQDLLQIQGKSWQDEYGAFFAPNAV